MAACGMENSQSFCPTLQKKPNSADPRLLGHFLHGSARSCPEQLCCSHTHTHTYSSINNTTSCCEAPQQHQGMKKQGAKNTCTLTDISDVTN